VPRLAISKRFEFSASHTTPDVCGDGPYGHGHNFIVFFSFEGPIDPNTGMVVELSVIKHRINTELLIHYDHHYLNNQPQFQSTAPTLPTIAQTLLIDAMTLFSNTPYSPIAVHIVETPFKSATATHRTLTTSIRHNNIGLTLNEPSDTPDTRIINAIDTLNFSNLPILTKRHYLPEYTIETNGSGHSFVEFHVAFSATHRLHRESLSEEANHRCFGKCYRPHGHLFETSVTIPYINRDSTTIQITQIESIINEWHLQALDQLPEFANQLASIETIIHVLWKKLGQSDIPVVRLRIHETPNNRFSLRS